MPISTIKLCLVSLFCLVLAACGGGELDSTNGSSSEPFDSSARVIAQASGTPPSQAISIRSLKLLSSTRISRSMWQYVYEVAVTNNGPAVSNATLSLQSVGPGTTIVSGTINTGPIPANANVSPAETITIQQDRQITFSLNALTWSIDSVRVPTSDLFSSVVFYPEVSNPLMLGFQLPNGDLASFYGSKDGDGSYNKGSGIIFKTPLDKRLLIEQDARGLPIAMTLPELGRLTFNWTNNRQFTLTGMTRSGQAISVPLTLPNPLPISLKAEPSSLNTAKARSLNAGVSLVNSFLTVRVRSNVPEPGADVWATFVPASLPGTSGYTLPLGEISPGTYGAGFVNFASSIAPGAISGACATVAVGYVRTCAVLVPVSRFMVGGGGCVALAAASTLAGTPVLGAGVLASCETVFNGSTVACAAAAFVPPNTTSIIPGICQAVESAAAYFDPDGINITARASKDVRNGSSTTFVGSRSASAEMIVLLPPRTYCDEGPGLTHGGPGSKMSCYSDVGRTRLVSEEIYAVVSATDSFGAGEVGEVSVYVDDVLTSAVSYFDAARYHDFRKRQLNSDGLTTLGAYFSGTTFSPGILLGRGIYLPSGAPVSTTGIVCQNLNRENPPPPNGPNNYRFLNSYSNSIGPVSLSQCPQQSMVNSINDIDYRTFPLYVRAHLP